jgi:C-terminal processing protease CtpA/Prc
MALLMTTDTASSGEAVVIAFIDRPNTRRFGTATRGLTTANDGFPLPDGATLMVTVGTFVDRFGRVYGQAIEPDQYVGGQDSQIQTVAAAWIHATAKARATRQQTPSARP